MDIMLGLGISTPAEWVQQPVIDETTLKLASEVRSTSYANFGICRQPSGTAATSLEDHPRTEVMARAIAEIAVGHAADSAKTKTRHMLHNTRKKRDDPQCAIQTALLNIWRYISDCSRMN